MEAVSFEMERGPPLRDGRDSKATLQTDTGTRKCDSSDATAPMTNCSKVLESVVYGATQYFSFR